MTSKPLNEKVSKNPESLYGFIKVKELDLADVRDKKYRVID